MTKEPKLKLTWYRTPGWLKSLQNLDVMPLRDLLRQSLFYPSSRCDGEPLRLLGGYIHSFVHADERMSKSDVLACIEGQYLNFSGYRLSMIREVMSEELFPAGWQPCQALASDSNLDKRCSVMPVPFALWAVYDRSPGFDQFYGPARFSLLHLHAEGAATYEGLYNQRGIQPEVLAILRQDDALTRNTTDYRDDQQILGRVAFRNQGRKPRYLLQDSSEIGYWHGYQREVERWTGPGNEYRLFACENSIPEMDEFDVGEYGGILGEKTYIGHCSIDRHRYEIYQRSEIEARRLRNRMIGE